MDLTREIHIKMINERHMFVYRGEITEKNAYILLTLLENEMKDNSYEAIGRKRLFMYVLENLQNIAKHGDHAGHMGMSLVAYSKTDEGYTITTGNIISSDQVDDLKERLEMVNRLGIEETKALYREILCTKEFTDKGGAGLGLIEMAVKTGNKLDYDFIKIEDDFYYFILSKTVDSKGLGTHSKNGENRFDSASFRELEEMMTINGIHLIWSGHLSSGVEDEMLNLTETKLAEEDIEANLRRRVFSIMVELLENVFKYNPGKESGDKFGIPVAMVRILNKKFVLFTGNLIYNSKVSELRTKLDTINSYDKEGLKEFFFESLSNQTIESDSTGNLGLITIARKAGNKLRYQFKPVNELFSFFMLTAEVADGEISEAV
jgi:hypothetical protein